MRNLVSIGHNEVRMYLKHRTSLIWLFGLPLLFATFMSFVPYGRGTAENRHPPVRIENSDTGFLSEVLVAELSAQGLWRVDPVRDPKVQPVRTIRIPADFTASVIEKRASNVELVPQSGADTQADGLLIEARLLRALVSVNSRLIESATVRSSAGWPPTQDMINTLAARPPLVALDSKYAGRRPVPTGANFSLPGNLVYFLMMNLLIVGGTTMVASRRSGALRRMVTLPVRRSEVIAGSIYGVWMLGVLQISFLLLVGRLAFRLNLGANLPGVLLVLVVYAWVIAALGVFIGSIMDTIERVVPLCVGSALIMAALSGCWFPLELGPDVFRVIAHCLPAGWAIDGLNRLISFGGDISSALQPVAVLAGFGLAATAAAARWFRV
jgi:ABC-2 type transport system permease protein